jgi:hypothetical protein
LEELNTRPAREVLDDLEPNVEDDLDRNVAEDCVILVNRGTFHGHQGVMQLAQMLGEELPEHRGFQYIYSAVEGRMAFLEWADEDAQVRVTDGAERICSVFSRPALQAATFGSTTLGRRQQYAP